MPFTLQSVPTNPADLEAVTLLLGREPRAEFEVVVRRDNGEPVVLRNASLMYDSTPMPTLYWLVDPELNRRVGTLEAEGGVRAAEAAVDAAALLEAHDAYAAKRDASLPESYQGPRPSGGVGGTRIGVKCLHAHYANFLAGGVDPVGEWVEKRLLSEVEESE
jgi:hypothetical protein